jgi:threonine dehydratase
LIPIAEIRAARGRLAGRIVRTPLVRLELPEQPGAVYLKLENLQPIGSFKLRGAGNALLLASPEELEHGVWTASAGNMAQGVAWWARKRGVRCTVVLPDTAPETKIAAIRRRYTERLQRASTQSIRTAGASKAKYPSACCSDRSEFPAKSSVPTLIL